MTVTTLPARCYIAIKNEASIESNRHVDSSSNENQRTGRTCDFGWIYNTFTPQTATTPSTSEPSTSDDVSSKPQVNIFKRMSSSDYEANRSAIISYLKTNPDDLTSKKWLNDNISKLPNFYVGEDGSIYRQPTEEEVQAARKRGESSLKWIRVDENSVEHQVYSSYALLNPVDCSVDQTRQNNLTAQVFANKTDTYVNYSTFLTTQAKFFEEADKILEAALNDRANWATNFENLGLDWEALSEMSDEDAKKEIVAALYKKQSGNTDLPNNWPENLDAQIKKLHNLRHQNLVESIDLDNDEQIEADETAAFDAYVNWLPWRDGNTAESYSYNLRMQLLRESSTNQELLGKLSSIRKGFKLTDSSDSNMFLALGRAVNTIAEFEGAYEESDGVLEASEYANNRFWQRMHTLLISDDNPQLQISTLKATNNEITKFFTENENPPNLEEIKTRLTPEEKDMLNLIKSNCASSPEGQELATELERYYLLSKFQGENIVTKLDRNGNNQVDASEMTAYILYLDKLKKENSSQPQAQAQNALLYSSDNPFIKEENIEKS